MNLYKVQFERANYNGETKIETRELFAESSSKINTYRLSGFQRDTITILNTQFIRKRLPVEVDVDLKYNEVYFSIDINQHIKRTLGNRLYELETHANELEMDLEDYLESVGYIEQVHDNSYNWTSDFSDDIDFKVYTKGDKDWIYSDESIVFIRVHTGIDVRAGYKFHGLYKTGDYEGLCYFLEGHVRVQIVDRDYNEIDWYDGASAVCSALRDYELVGLNDEGEIIVLNSDNEELILTYYHSVEGV